MFARLYQNKCSKFSIIFLSKVVVKRDMGYAKYKRWTKEVQSKKGEKEKEMRIKITHVLAKNIPQERNILHRA